MKMKYDKSAQQGPSSAIGIMKFKEGLNGPKLTPETIIALAVGLCVLILVLRFVFGLS